MRRPNGRCSLSGSVWPSPDSTSSHLQISDAVRIRQRQLLGETLATTPFRRQERDFSPQRLRSEIGRVPVRRTRDSKDALEKPAVSGHFRRVSTCRLEPVSRGQIPVYQEKNREFCKFEGVATTCPRTNTRHFRRVARSVDQVRLHIGKAPAILDQCSAEIASRERGVDTDGKPSALAPGTGLEAGRDRFPLLNNSACRLQEFQSFNRRSRAAVGSLKELDAKHRLHAA